MPIFLYLISILFLLQLSLETHCGPAYSTVALLSFHAHFASNLCSGFGQFQVIKLEHIFFLIAVFFKLAPLFLNQNPHYAEIFEDAAHPAADVVGCVACADPQGHR
jgi:hypothetical protein